MPPKLKTTREDILSAALDALRLGGPDALNARALAGRLGCSTQPIFSHFPTMEQLRSEVTARAYRLYDERVHAEMAAGRYPPYKASGMAYIRFAREEPNLFRLLFMRDRTGEPQAQRIEGVDDILALIQKSQGFTYEQAHAFHLQMWLYTHGIAAMSATGYLELDEDAVGALLTQIYEGLRLYFAAHREE